MSGYQYFIPVISIAPPDGYRLHETVRVDAIAKQINTPEADLLIERRIFGGGEELQRHAARVQWRNGEWSGDDPDFDFDSIDEGHWREGESIRFVETHVGLDAPEGTASVAATAAAFDGGSAKRLIGFAGAFLPPSYKIYHGHERKTFFSDNALKYGNTVVIYQIDAFGKAPGYRWVEGCPLSCIDRSADIGESVVLINPFMRAATVRIDVSGVVKSHKIRVDPLHARRVAVADLVSDHDSWMGQILVS
ncbi:MAG: hypothetical protein QGF53_11020, partial [Alphaproteobacteria bacterium]|nr:hypothetical protein [Alphaproteobacteria bacterium]